MQRSAEDIYFCWGAQHGLYEKNVIEDCTYGMTFGQERFVGAAMPFAFSKQLAAGAPHRAIYRRMASRFAVLWVFGMMVQGDLLKLDWATLRPFTNVLQTIACGYVVTGLMLLHVPRRFHAWTTAALLVGYWLLMTLVPVSGLGAGVLEEDRNLATWIDLSILGSHGYRHSVEGGFTTHYGFFLPIMTFSAIITRIDHVADH